MTSVTTRTCPTWCESDHTDDPPYVRNHRGRWLCTDTLCTGTWPVRLRVGLRFVEHTDPDDRRLDRTYVYLGAPLVEDAALLLEPRDALSLAAVLDVMGQAEVARLLRDAVADLGEDGAR